MSRRKKRRQDHETRDVLTSLTDTLRSQQSQSQARRSSMRGLPVHLVEDFRRFDPEPYGLPKLFSGVTASVDVATPSPGTRRKTKVPYQIAFTAPAATIQCVRRQRRKEVMFAKNKAGKGKGRQRRPRWSRWSDIRC